MASTTLNSRIILCSKTTASWASTETVALRGELLIELTDGAPKFKVGDGVGTFSELPYAAMTPAEVAAAITAAAYVLPKATSEILGGVKIGSNVSVASDGTISIADASTAAKGVVQLLDSTNSTSTTKAATPNAVKTVNDLVIAAMPKTGGTFTGAVTLHADPTSNLHAATKQYVDSQITEKLEASDAMVFKGTLGTNGTVDVLPTLSVVTGDTYKVITAGTYAGYACTVGDLLIAANSGDISSTSANWVYVPSGNETVTTIRYSTSTQNLTTSEQSGSLIVGEAATKQVDTSIAAASTSTKLPTSAAVASFVEGKGYSTSDDKMGQTSSNLDNTYPLLASENHTPTSGNAAKAIYSADITINPSTGTVAATAFSGNASSATKLNTAKNFSITGKATASAVSFDGSDNVALNVTEMNANGLMQTTGDYLILDGNF